MLVIDFDDGFVESLQHKSFARSLWRVSDQTDCNLQRRHQKIKDLLAKRIQVKTNILAIIYNDQSKLEKDLLWIFLYIYDHNKKRSQFESTGNIA